MPELTLTLSPLQSRLQHVYHGQPYARVDVIPQSGTLDLAFADPEYFIERRRYSPPGCFHHFTNCPIILLI
jgi:hypothetical protein